MYIHKSVICTIQTSEIPSITCPLCNNNHKKENIKNYIEGLWGSGDYVNTTLIASDAVRIQSK